MNLKYILRRMTGHKFDSRFTWGEFSWHPKHWKLAFEYCPAGMFEHNTLIVHFLIAGVYLHLPTRRHGDGCMRGEEPQYGFYTYDNSLVICHGKTRTYLNYPWFTLQYYSTEILTFNRERRYIEYAHDRLPWGVRKATEDQVKEEQSVVYRYLYTLKSGEVQHRKATVHVTRMTWRRKWFPMFKHVSTYIDVAFDGEVGERTGSWKGGTIGCSYEMNPDETPLQCLYRMERERKF